MAKATTNIILYIKDTLTLLVYNILNFFSAKGVSDIRKNLELGQLKE